MPASPARRSATAAGQQFTDKAALVTSGEESFVRAAAAGAPSGQPMVEAVVARYGRLN
jgi:hypothetical protein